MGYPTGIYANSIKNPEKQKNPSIAKANSTPNQNSGAPINPLSGFGLHRELGKMKMKSDIINSGNIINGLGASYIQGDRGGVPKINSMLEANKNGHYRIEDFKGLKNILDDERDYSVALDEDEDGLDAELDEIEQNFV